MSQKDESIERVSQLHSAQMAQLMGMHVGPDEALTALVLSTAASVGASQNFDPKNIEQMRAVAEVFYKRLLDRINHLIEDKAFTAKVAEARRTRSL